MRSLITAIGSATPQFRQSQMKILDFMVENLELSPAAKRKLEIIYKHSQVDFRQSVLECFTQSMKHPFFSTPASTQERMEAYKKHALTLALAAIKNCLVNLPVNKNEISHLIVTSCTGMYSPGLDIEIIQSLNLSSQVHRTNIHFMGCSAAFNALKLADAILGADPKAKVLLVCVELCSLHFKKSTDLDNLIANAIFADGASAALIQAKPYQTKHLSIEQFFCDLFTDTKKDLTWEIANQGFDMKLSTNVPRLIQSKLRSVVETFLNKISLSLEDISFFAIHPGGKNILEACQKGLNLNAAHYQYSSQVLQQYGNMSSATILFVLQQLLNTSTADDHLKNVLGLGFGPGLCVEGMMLKVQHV